LRLTDTLILSNNDLTGTIPALMGSWTALENFEINSNQIVGTIPKSIANMKNLAFLDLGNNRLTGAIPDTLFNMGNLRKFGYFFRCIDFCSLQICSQPYRLHFLGRIHQNERQPIGWKNSQWLGEFGESR
jgi:hypothetical protein